MGRKAVIAFPVSMQPLFAVFSLTLLVSAFGRQGGILPDLSGDPKPVATPAGWDYDACISKPQQFLLPQWMGFSTEWMSFEAMDALLQTVKPDVHPILMLSIRYVPCAATGCCSATVYMRPRSSDWGVIGQVFTNNFQGYLIRKGSDPFWKPANILDAGANVGYATVVYKHLYPDAKVVCVEPDKENAMMLFLNTRQFSSIHLENKGLWWRAANVEVVSPSQLGFKGRGGKWGLMITEVPKPTDKSIEATTVPLIMERHKVDVFDLLKIDIEGAEHNLIAAEGSKDWIAKAHTMSIEIHHKDSDTTDESALEDHNKIARVCQDLGFGLFEWAEDLVCEKPMPGAAKTGLN